VLCCETTEKRFHHRDVRGARICARTDTSFYLVFSLTLVPKPMRIGIKQTTKHDASMFRPMLARDDHLCGENAFCDRITMPAFAIPEL